MARDDAGDRNAFMRWAKDKINATPGHPLEFLIDPKTHDWLGPRVDTNWDHPVMQAGHVVTRGHGLDQFALEDAWFNVAVGGRAGEGNPKRTDFHLIDRGQPVNIGGIPVDSRTAHMLERLGQLHVPGGVDALPPMSGWLPPGSTDAIVSEPLFSLLVPEIFMGNAAAAIGSSVGHAVGDGIKAVWHWLEPDTHADDSSKSHSTAHDTPPPQPHTDTQPATTPPPAQPHDTDPPPSTEPSDGGLPPGGTPTSHLLLNPDTHTADAPQQTLAALLHPELGQDSTALDSSQHHTWYASLFASDHADGAHQQPAHLA